METIEICHPAFTASKKNQKKKRMALINLVHKWLPPNCDLTVHQHPLLSFRIVQVDDQNFEKHLLSSWDVHYISADSLIWQEKKKDPSCLYLQRMHVLQELTCLQPNQIEISSFVADLSPENVDKLAKDFKKSQHKMIIQIADDFYQGLGYFDFDYTPPSEFNPCPCINVVVTLPLEPIKWARLRPEFV